VEQIGVILIVRFEQALEEYYFTKKIEVSYHYNANVELLKTSKDDVDREGSEYHSYAAHLEE
jgi:hypothetical protein